MRTSPGSALIFSADQQEATRNILPTLTVAMNSLPGGVCAAAASA